MAQEIRTQILGGAENAAEMSPHAENTIARRLRKRMVQRAAAAGAISKVVSAACNFAAIPLVIHAMGDMQFGMWATYSSLQLVLPFADFGIGNGMMNEITRAGASRDSARIQQLVTTGFAMLSIIATCIGVAAIASSLYFDLGTRLASTESPALRQGLAIFVSAGLLSIPLSCPDRVASALQAGYMPHFVRSAAALVSLCLTWLLAQTNATFDAFCLATVLPVLVAPLATWAWLSRRFPHVRPRISAFELSSVPRMARTGLAFFLLQLILVFGYGLDTVLVEQVAGGACAGEFTIVQRFFGLVPAVAGIALAPLWPAYADALARADYAWINTVSRRAFIVSGLAGVVAAVILVLAAQVLIPLWVRNSAPPSSMLVYACGLWAAAIAPGASLAFCWNGLHWLRLQVVLGAAFAGVSMAAKLLLLRSDNSYVVAAANALTYTGLVIIPGAYITHYQLKALRSRVFVESQQAISHD